MNINITIIGFVLTIGLWACAAEAPITKNLIRDGAFILMKEEVNGTDQTVSMTLTRNNKAMHVELSIVWIPGAVVELSGMATRSQKSANTLSMKFTDNFENQGEAVLVFTAKAVEIEIKALNVVEPRSARQYGKYVLHDSAPK